MDFVTTILNTVGTTPSFTAFATNLDIQTVQDSLISTLPITSQNFTLPVAIELFAAVMGAIAGALRGCLNKLDWIGVCFLALATALGGGLLRDMIMPTNSVYMLDNPIAVITCVSVALLVFYFSGLFESNRMPMIIADIISVGLFAFLGAEKALVHGYSTLPCILMGVLTAVGGGALRDICLGETPQIFRQSNYYAVASIAGSITYVGLVELHVIKAVACIACVAVTLALRLLSIKYNWQTPGPYDLSHHVKRPLKQLMSKKETVVLHHTVDQDEPLDVETIAQALSDKDGTSPEVVVVMLDPHNEETADEGLKTTSEQEPEPMAKQTSEPTPEWNRH